MPKKCYCGNENLGEYSEHYYVCDKCHTLISKVDFDSDLYDVKDEENDLYGKNYWQKMMEDMTGQTSLEGVIDFYLRGRVAYWIQYILKYIPLESKVAEIGCGLGQLAYVMKTLGYSQMAYELSPDICEYIKDALGVNIHCGEFQTSNETYDAVLAFDLFEHLTQPKEFLQGVFDRLSPNGVLCLQMPSYDSSLSYEKMLEKKSRFAGHLTEFQHVFLYSKEAAVLLLKEVGFKDIIFEPACFGDDYDMFLFAAKQKLEPISHAEIEERLDKVNAGRLVKALYHLYEENTDLKNKLEIVEKDSIKRLENAEILEKQLEESEQDRAERLKVIEDCNVRMQTLDETCNTLNHELVIREQQRQEKEQQIQVMERQVQEKEQQIQAMEPQVQEKRQQIENLQNQLVLEEESKANLEKMLDLYWKEIEKTKKF